MAKNPFNFSASKNADNPTGETAPTGNASPGSVAVDDARAEAAARLETRGNKPGTIRGPYNKKGRDPASVADKSGVAKPGPSRIPPEVLADMERMYSPEIWEPLIELPAAAMQTLTGHDHWQIDDKEKRILSVSVSTAARYMGFQNPKWLAINLALINLMTVYAPRAIKEFALRRLEKAQQKKTPPADVPK